MTPSVSVITFTHNFRDRSEVFKVVKILNVVLWVTIPPSLLDRYRRFGGAQCSTYLEDEGYRFIRNGYI
jgi:hypothetical protein